ncbi:chromatin associated protein KTI12, partial [Dipodascopsis tothii]|uniref:chromatin associated protein KTI12 n=1 Tax=Dipodascopsis tothii TaxID=44089 RepID=UPI0034CE64F1
MPLIVITGYPCSGKTTRAREIVAGLQARAPSKRFHVFSDESLGFGREVYRDSRQEKQVRAELMSALKRHLSADDVVVLDSLNYIKGFRYQLFCEAKAEQTTYAVVHVAAPADKCREWNAAGRLWPDDVFDQVVFRYEEPSAQTRWDSPLTTAVYFDPIERVLDGLYAALFERAVKPPNFATVVRPAATGEYVTELERITTDVVRAVVQAAQDGVGQIALGVGDDRDVVVLPVAGTSAGQVQRLRRTFVGLNRVRPIEAGRIQRAFVEYLNRQF